MPLLSQKKTQLTLSSAKMTGYWPWHALCLMRGECLKQGGVPEESESNRMSDNKTLKRATLALGRRETQRLSSTNQELLKFYDYATI